MTASSTPQTPATTPATSGPVTAQPQQTSKSGFATILANAKFDEVLPSFMKDKAKDFVRLAMVDIPRNENLTRIAKATPQKIVAVLMDCARLGLMPGPLGHVYLVPFGDEVQIIAGYKGLVELARRSGKVVRVDADVIYEDDDFAFIKGDHPKFEHVPNIRSQKRSPNSVVAAYAFAYDAAGRNLGGTVMTRADIESVRLRSKSGGSGPWKTDWTEMAKKTAIRRASKLWPISTEFAEAAAWGDDDDPRPSGTMPGTVSAPERLEGKSVLDPNLYDEAERPEAGT